MNAPVRISKEAEMIKLAVLAVGGQGGGVLTNWIADLADKGGYAVQMTSVAGVAQRTGATIYYVEMAPKTDRLPVFALAPAPGDLDVLIAAELMEAGRAVLRGFVTPDRTTLIASTHRILAVSEKQVPGDGRAEGELVHNEITKAALKTVCFDMDTISRSEGSMISAGLFGGLARSGALPFDVALFEEVISASGRGAAASLAAFRGVLHHDETKAEPKLELISTVAGPEHLKTGWNTLLAKVKSFPDSAQTMISAGLQKTVDYQDLDYGEVYLALLDSFKDGPGTLLEAAAKYICNAMCYDDLIRVADLKTRASRQARLRQEQEIAPDEIVHVTEYFHPRAQEVCGTLPARIGAWIEARPKAVRLLERLVNRGRRMRTDGLRGFGSLWVVAGLKPYRRKLLRHRHEQAHLDNWLEMVARYQQDNPDLATEILKCQRLIKGYSDTHARGQSKFAMVTGCVAELAGRDDAADWVRRLREAALQDEEGEALEGALKTVRSFV